MFKMMALFTKKKYWLFHSAVVVSVLRIYGIKVGKRLYIEGVPRLKINGKAGNIAIGDDVSILGDIDIRNRENGKIVFEDGVKIENDCRFVSAREGTISIGAGSVVGAFSILNGGSDIIIGKDCLISARVSINANEHKCARDEKIKSQSFLHLPVIIEDDCLIGVNAVINKGVTLKKGSVIGANSVVTQDTEEYSINAGVPARKIKERE